MIDELLPQVRTIVTHENCPDGIASAMILKHSLPNADVVFLQHGSPEMAAFEPSPGQLWCDVCPPADRAQAFVDAGAIVLDHHKGAEATVAMFGDRGVFADEKLEPGVSGAVLAWREVYMITLPHAAKVAEMALLAGIRDTWRRESERWEDACAQAEALVFFGSGIVGLGRAWLLDSEMEVGRLILKKRLEEARRKAATATVIGRVALVSERYVSDVAEALRELRPEVELAVGFSYVEQSDRTMSVVFSLRSSSDEVDCAVIAKANGGGGHTRAAGFAVQNGLYACPGGLLWRALDKADRNDLLDGEAP